MSIDLTVENRLDGASNFSPWKERITLILKVNDLLNFAKTTVTPPINATLLEEHNRKDDKTRMLILDVVTNHSIPHISRKKTTKEMWEALLKIYQSDNHNKKMVLRDKLRAMKMSRTDTAATYFTWITQVHDELTTIREIVDDPELVRTALNGFTKSREVFVAGIVAQENLPKFGVHVG